MSALPDRKDRPEYVNLSPSDWQGGCRMLPPMAEWVLWQISLYCMDKGEAVPVAILPMLLARHSGDWQGDIDLLLDLRKLHRTNSGALFSRRALVEYERANTALKKKRQAGKKGAEKRWQNSDLDGDANATRIAAEQSRAEVDLSSKDTTAPGDLLITIENEVWNAFAEHRIKLRAPLTKRAADMIKNELVRIHEQFGHDPNAVLRQSVLRGWKGVFPLKDDSNGDGRRSGWRFDHE